MTNSCVICEEPTNFFNRRKIANDETVCENCIKKASSGLSFKQTINLKKLTSDQIRESIVASNDNGEEILNFKATKKIGDFVHFDDAAEKWLIPGKKTLLPTPDLIFNYSDVVDFELLEDGESIASGGLGRALAGGILFGGVGAIVGGVTGKRKTKGVCSSLKLKITINDMNNPVIYINFIDTKTKKDSNIYNIISQQAQECLSIFQLICDKQKGNNNDINDTTSSADEIRKFKELFDEGIISEDEFNAKRKELLGL